VDLHKVQIKVEEDNRLIVGGLSMSTTADTLRSADWQLQEVRTEILRDDKLIEIIIDPHDRRMVAERDAHERQLRERISAGQTFTVFERPLLQASREALASLLSPLGREIVFVDTAPPDGLPLLSFLAAEQKLLRDQIENRRRELATRPR
jgi:hypothetical protein